MRPAYGVYTSHLIAIARACDKDFEICHNGLCCRLMQQGFTYQTLCMQLNKTLKNHTTLFNKYGARIEVPLAIMANNTNKHVTVRS